MKKIDRTGERFFTCETLGGYECIIINYNNYDDVTIQIQDEHKAIIHTQYQHCKSGKIVNPYHKSVYGVGYLGQGEYCAYSNRIATKQYTYWKDMLKRCYDKKYHDKYQTYKNVTVNEELFCFQNFAKWFDSNYYEIDGEHMCLDKDILLKGNREYSFDTMIFVPHRINLLFVKNDCDRGDLPIGVSYTGDGSKFRARCSILDENGTKKQKALGVYNTPEQAFQAYKKFKESYIKQIADEYKDKIPKKLYDALYSYEVEITD